MDKNKKLGVFDLTPHLNHLTVDDLRTLNQAIISILNDKAHDAKDDLKVGQLVQFKGKRQEWVRGKITGKLTKNITIISTEGARWRVNPTLVMVWDGKMYDGTQWDGKPKTFAW